VNATYSNKRDKPGDSISEPGHYPDASIELATFAARQKCLVNVTCGFYFGRCQSAFLSKQASKRRRIRQLLKKSLFALLLLFSPTVFAQSAPAAEGSGRTYWVGAEGSTFNPDWGCTSSSPFTCWDHQLFGIAAFTDVNHLIGKIGVEGEGRWLNWRGPGNGIKQSNYLAGPRYQIYSWRRFSTNVKFLAGGATFHRKNTWEGWAAFAPGMTFGYRVSSRFLVRVDYEYQMWPGFLNRGLTPNGFSVGASYRIFR
jgi:hypothetical protein